jgi:hypothetical protein
MALLQDEVVSQDSLRAKNRLEVGPQGVDGFIHHLSWQHLSAVFLFKTSVTLPISVDR